MSNIDVSNRFEENRKRFIEAKGDLTGFLIDEGFGDKVQPLLDATVSFADCIKYYSDSYFHNGQLTRALSVVANDIEATLKSLSEKAEAKTLGESEVKERIASLSQQIMEERNKLEEAKVSIPSTKIDGAPAKVSVWGGITKRIEEAMKPENEKELDKILVDKLSYVYEFYDDLKNDGLDNIAHFLKNATDNARKRILSVYRDAIKRNPNKKDDILECCVNAAGYLPALGANYISAVESEIYGNASADPVIKIVSIHDDYFNEVIDTFHNNLVNGTGKSGHNR